MTPPMTDDLVGRLRLRRDHGDMMYSRMLLVNPDGDEAAARIEALEAEKALFRQVFERLDQGRGPGHCHTIPGIWDNDSSNGDKAGTPCEWCALWSEVRAALTPEVPHAD